MKGSTIVSPDQPHAEVAQATPTRRDRDITNYVISRPVHHVIIGSLTPDDIDSEAFARKIGNWGNHSAHLGTRWEEVAGHWAERQVGSRRFIGDIPFMLRGALPLDSDPVLKRELSRMGLSCPDLLFIGMTEAGRVVLQAVDCKVSLDTASFDQIQQYRILELAEHGGPNLTQTLRAGLRTTGVLPQGFAPEGVALLHWMTSDAVMLNDGIFASPDNGFNRSHLQCTANKRRRRPLSSDDVVLIPTSEEEYLGGLPGWDESLALRILDGVAMRPVDLSIAERYYRIGAGLVCAINTVEQPLFGPLRSIDTIARLQARIQQTLVHSSIGVVDVLQRELDGRKEPVERRKRLDRFPVPFRDVLLRAQKLASVPVPAERLRPGLEQLTALHRTALHDRGAWLLAAGHTEEDVLGRLERESPQRLLVAQADVSAFVSSWIQNAGYTSRG